MLQAQGAHNINLVTPTHFTPQIVAALKSAKSQGLSIPVVYNTSGYETVHTLRMLEGFVEIYLPDFKYYSAALSQKYSNAPDYFAYASRAIAEMVRQTGAPVFDGELMRTGVIVRHMVLPGHVKDSKAVSIMNQYTPPKDMEGYPELGRRLTRREYERVVDYAIKLGLQNAFIQEGDTAKESFIPDFDDEQFLKEVRDHV